VVFGRAPTCEIVLEHLSISRQHATLSTDTAGNLYLTDLGSGSIHACVPMCSPQVSYSASPDFLLFRQVKVSAWSLCHA
jgi:hypothetical protein